MTRSEALGERTPLEADANYYVAWLFWMFFIIAALEAVPESSAPLCRLLFPFSLLASSPRVCFSRRTVRFLGELQMRSN